jgi:hypothetical protein
VLLLLLLLYTANIKSITLSTTGRRRSHKETFLTFFLSLLRSLSPKKLRLPFVVRGHFFPSSPKGRSYSDSRQSFLKVFKLDGVCQKKIFLTK